MSENYTHLRVERSGHVATVTLSRPDVHNAFNPVLIGELHRCFEALAFDESVRIVVLTGDGLSFCAGADLNWMRESLRYTREENLDDAERMAAMFESINSLPKPLIGRINGAAMGGGVGLVACCDIAVAVNNARFGFSEVKLGLIPAVIAQYVVPKIGPSHARALFISGERFGADVAHSIGLIHRVVSPEALDQEISRVIAELTTSGPGAMAAAKNLVRAIMHYSPAEARLYTIEAIATLRTSPEGQEGLGAFLEKRKPSWSA
ncbi:MAG: enoyl-CoA hydratase [Herpetosiphonaceae bacterium]|nr:MAG: enoyl-CoA hydratase [Herpetosiphonaceae bacterium]